MNKEQIAKEAKRVKMLNSVRIELENGRMSTFLQMFAFIRETPLSDELKIPFMTFRRKCNNPLEFNLDEMIRMAKLFGTKFTVIQKFIIAQLKKDNDIKTYFEE